MAHDGLTLVYCTLCQKTHSVRLLEEEPCAPGAWLDPDPIHDPRDLTFDAAFLREE